ncbi:hypothetical protein ACLOJK_020529 [Asimina triloba]
MKFPPKQLLSLLLEATLAQSTNLKMAATSTSKASTSLSLKEYLKRYEDPSEEKKKTKKKKSKHPTTSGLITAVQVFDEDPVWQKPVNLEEDKDSDSAAEEQPQIDEDIEVKRMKRLEAIRSRRPYGAISEDGSGWVSVSDASRELNAGIEAQDLSPPHQQHGHLETQSPEPGPHALSSVGVDADLSPPQHLHPSMSSPDLKMNNLGRHDSPDLSPPRRSHQRSPGEDLKPSKSMRIKRRRQDSTAVSPRRGHHHSPELDSKQSGSVSMNSDLSLPQHSHKQMDLSDFRKKSSERHDSQDFSPPRRTDLSAESSPKVAGRHDSPDLSPPRRSRRHSSPSDSTRKDLERSKSLDLSPPRRLRPSTSSDLKRNNPERPELQDLSPPRRSRRHSPEIHTSHVPSKEDLSPPRHEKHASSIKGGRMSGLLSKNEFKEETKRKRKEISGFPEMDPFASGRGAEPVYRDKLSGRRISKEEFLKPQQGEEKPKEKKLEWGKGLAQKREAEERELELEQERDKPFARSR